MPRFLLALAIIISLCVGATQAQTPAQPKWDLVQGLRLEGYQMYVDRGTLNLRMNENVTESASGVLLLVPDSTAMQFKNKAGKTISALSLVRVLAVQCKSGIAIPVMDLYYDTKTPGADTKSIGNIDYSKAPPINILPKTSALYRTLCPKFSV